MRFPLRQESNFNKCGVSLQILEKALSDNDSEFSQISLSLKSKNNNINCYKLKLKTIMTFYVLLY